MSFWKIELSPFHVSWPSRFSCHEREDQLLVTNQPVWFRELLVQNQNSRKSTEWDSIKATALNKNTRNNWRNLMNYLKIRILIKLAQIPNSLCSWSPCWNSNQLIQEREDVIEHWWRLLFLISKRHEKMLKVQYFLEAVMSHMHVCSFSIWNRSVRLSLKHPYCPPRRILSEIPKIITNCSYSHEATRGRLDGSVCQEFQVCKCLTQERRCLKFSRGSLDCQDGTGRI
jgi:hypothetical protein